MEQFQEKVNEIFAKKENLLSRKNIPTPCTDSRAYPDLLEI